MAEAEFRILSRRMVRPSPRTNDEGRIEKEIQQKRIIHLNPWDLRMISIDYIQKGILFRKPQHLIISGLLTSFSRALDHFFPLAGRLSTTNHHHDDDALPSSLSISLDCNDQGAEFIHASAAHVTVSDLLTPLYTPPIVHSFFPLNGALGYDGHSLPLLAAQITELADGIFIACSLNHVVADGTSFWHFFNTWSEISRTGGDCQINNPPVLDRWFLDSCTPPIHLPFKYHTEFIRRVPLPPVRECVFHFSAKTIAKLKTKANEEMDTNRISSLQALLAHIWRSVTRARALDSGRETTYVVVVGNRARVSPPLPQAYLGNSMLGIPAKALAGEVVEKGLGWSAWVLKQAIASQSEVAVRNWIESWPKNPSMLYIDRFKRPWHMVTGSSPRFDVYGNDFGWGRPVAVRSGDANKVDGNVTVYPGPEGGSMALEVCLSAEALSALVGDREFMETVG